MKAATFTVNTITINCPYCGGVLCDPKSGSSFLDKEALDRIGGPGTVIVCDTDSMAFCDCGRRFKLPAVVGRVL